MCGKKCIILKCLFFIPINATQEKRDNENGAIKDFLHFKSENNERTMSDGYILVIEERMAIRTKTFSFPEKRSRNN